MSEFIKQKNNPYLFSIAIYYYFFFSKDQKIDFKGDTTEISITIYFYLCNNNTIDDMTHMTHHHMVNCYQTCTGR